jgi:hypothetical protein
MKNERSNIDKDEEEGLKKLATHLLSLGPEALEKAKRALIPLAAMHSKK